VPAVLAWTFCVKKREEVTSMTKLFEEFFSSIGVPLRKERTLFNGEQLDQNREDVLIAMYLMGMNR
jgi:hypothetical protein